MRRYRRALDAFAEATEVSAADMDRARARWRASTPGRRPRWVSARIGLVAALGAAALGAAALYVRGSGLEPRSPMDLGGGGAVDVALREGVRISGAGEAVLSGERGARRVALEGGALHFEVRPDAGLSLEVATAEGQVAVVGTVFDVSRDVLGTAVAVSRGAVRVACEGGEEHLLHAGERARCRSARGYLERGKEVAAAGGGPEAVLAATEGAASLPAEPAVRAALDALRLSALGRAGRHAEALTGARAWLADGERVAAYPEESAALRRLAARSADQLGGCALAMPWLETLRGAGAEGVDMYRYGVCLSRSDPVAARAALEEALELGLDPALAARVRELLGR